MVDFAILCSCYYFIVLLSRISTASDSITTTTTPSIKDSDNETLISAGGSFELGFFSPGSNNNSSKRYLGIWYKKILPTQTVVWVANRETPLTGSSGSGVLKLTPSGALVLISATSGNTAWSSNSTAPAEDTAQGTVVAQLLESGNLVVRENKTAGKYIWQSFDYPCDTILPGLKLGKNLVTGLDRRLTSWKSHDDPSPGDYTYGFDTHGYPQKVVRRGSVETFRSGPWNGLQFSGTPQLMKNSIYQYEFVMNDKEVYFTYELSNPSVITRAVLSSNGIVQRFTWSDRTREWRLYLTIQTDNCDTYSFCGAYGSCSVGDAPVCGCLKGFEPKYAEDWGRGDWSSGCVRRTALNCLPEGGGDAGDGFVKYSGIKVPDTKESWFDARMDIEGCRLMCLKNCSCTAYSSLDISTEAGSGCLLWFGELLDIRVFTENGQDVYVRMAAADIDRVSTHRKEEVKIVVGSITGMLILGLAMSFYFHRKKKLTKRGSLRDTFKDPKEAVEVPLFTYAAMSNATNHFSTYNKLGEGGFGPVYKGKLEGVQEFAVKVLSEDSRQGLDEFKNEVLFIAKLQHRNLVKLLGCCIEERKMLIYEYLPNKSLDYFIFDKERSTLLGWQKRLEIINGISRGLLYMHQDSRLRIIHRDLKVSNVLLDDEMNPKISDFGLARSFQGNQTEENTDRIVGTHGYMSPEYAMDGHFSVKSDVFSFGVLVLEIVSGKRNRGFNHPNHDLNLLGHAWRLFRENSSSELVDLSVRESCNDPQEVFRLIHIGLLCVQEFPEQRPSMSEVVWMLGGEGCLQEPKRPGFYMQRKSLDSVSASSIYQPGSANEISITSSNGR